jgi:hypothetical protein
VKGSAHFIEPLEICQTFFTFFQPINFSGLFYLKSLG